MPADTKLPAVKAEDLIPRLNYCAGLLYVQGVITAREREKIHKRLLNLQAARTKAAKPKRG